MKRHVEKGQNKRTRITIGAREIEGKVLKRGKRREYTEFNLFFCSYLKNYLKLSKKVK